MNQAPAHQNPDDFSDLEDTLRQLQPSRVSPGLQSDIEARLRRSISPWRLALAVAALVAIGVTTRLALDGGDRLAVVQTPPIPATLPDDAPPTWLAYHRALGQSEAALDQLLARQSADLLPRQPGDDLRIH